MNLLVLAASTTVPAHTTPPTCSHRIREVGNASGATPIFRKNWHTR